jgi:hypothetical protein
MNTITLLNDSKYFEEGNTKFAELRYVHCTFPTLLCFSHFFWVFQLFVLRTMLDSNNEKDKLEAMKRLLAMMTVGRDVSNFFPDVVKCVIVNSQEVKKLGTPHPQKKRQSQQNALCENDVTISPSSCSLYVPDHVRRNKPRAGAAEYQHFSKRSG